MSLSHLLDSPTVESPRRQPSTHSAASTPPLPPQQPYALSHSQLQTQPIPPIHSRAPTSRASCGNPSTPYLQKHQPIQQDQQPVSELSGVTQYRGVSQSTDVEQDHDAHSFPNTTYTHSLGVQRQYRFEPFHSHQGEPRDNQYDRVPGQHLRVQSSPDFHEHRHEIDVQGAPDMYNFNRSDTASPLNQPLRHLRQYPPHSHSHYQYGQRQVYSRGVSSYKSEPFVSTLRPSTYDDNSTNQLDSKAPPLVHEPKTKRPWTEGEDAQLRELTASLGVGLWAAIAEHIPGRTGKQVRERWLNHLSPTVVKRPWSPDEDRIIIAAHSQYGNSWSKICKLLEGRSENMCKNRFWTKLCKLTPANATRASKSSDRLKIGVQRPLSKR